MYSKGSICFGSLDGNPFLYLVVGEKNGEDLFLWLTTDYDIYVGDVFGTEMGVNSDTDVMNAYREYAYTDTSPIAHISKEEVDRILKEGNFTVEEDD